MNLRELGERTSGGERKKAGGGKGTRTRKSGSERGASERENRAGESARRGPAEPE